MPFTVEVNQAETWPSQELPGEKGAGNWPGCDDKQVRFRAAKEQKFDRAVNAQKIARSRHPTVLERQIEGQGMKLVDKRWDVPIRQHTKERFQGTVKTICTTTTKFGVVWGGLTEAEKTKLSGLCDEKAVKEQRSATAYSKYVQDPDTLGRCQL